MRPFAFALAAALFFAASEGGAADPIPNRVDTRERAWQLYRESSEAYRRGEFRRAIALLEEAYSKSPEPVLLYNIARSHESLGELESAIEKYTRYLAAAPDVRDRGALELHVETLRDELATRTRLARERDREKERAQLARARAESTEKRTLPLVLGGVGAALLATSGVSFALFRAAEGDARTAASQAEAAREYDKADTLRTLSVTTLVSGFVLTVTAGIFYFVGQSRGVQSKSARVGGCCLGPT